MIAARIGLDIRATGHVLFRDAGSAWWVWNYDSADDITLPPPGQWWGLCLGVTVPDDLPDTFLEAVGGKARALDWALMVLFAGTSVREYKGDPVGFALNLGQWLGAYGERRRRRPRRGWVEARDRVLRELLAMPEFRPVPSYLALARRIPGARSRPDYVGQLLNGIVLPASDEELSRELKRIDGS
jgi:hypothetical protein